MSGEVSIWDYIRDPNNSFHDNVLQYIQMCGTAIVLAILISLPLAVLVARRPLLAFIANNSSGLLRSIPSIAILAVALPVLGIGFKPAVLALTVVGIPPILLNAIAGLQGIDPAVIDAAKGMGMNRLQILLRIEFPLALPVVIAGLRTSAVQVIATGTLSFIIGVPGLGYYISVGLFGGINSDTALQVGAFSVGALALVTELILAFTQQIVTPKGVRVHASDGLSIKEPNTSDAALVAKSV